jgi:hypothetical protein
MESYLEENFGGVKGKNSSEEALRRWRKLCSVVKNPKRRFRFTANLDKRGEAQAIKHANHVPTSSLSSAASFRSLRLTDLVLCAASPCGFGWGFPARICGGSGIWRLGLPRRELVGLHAGRPAASSTKI